MVPVGVTISNRRFVSMPGSNGAPGAPRFNFTNVLRTSVSSTEAAKYGWYGAQRNVNKDESSGAIKTVHSSK